RRYALSKTSLKLCMFPSPLWGRVRDGGREATRERRRLRMTSRPPPPPPPRQACTRARASAARVGEGKDGYAASALPGFSGGVIAPETLMSATSLSEYLSTLRKISSVCSPRSGERRTSAGESDNLIGLPTVRYLPRPGWSTSTTVPVARNDPSSAISFIDRIGPTGMSYLLQMSMTSNLVLVMVHCSM